MNKLDLLRKGDTLYRVLSMKENKVLVVDCMKRTMPRWVDIQAIEGATLVSEEELYELTHVEKVDMVTMDTKAKRKAMERHGLIVGVLMFLEDDELRSKALAKVAKENNISRKTLTNYLCTYLVYQDVAYLAPKTREEQTLTKDQKNMRWALNKFYYTRHGNTLMDSYVMMLKEKYLDEEGNLAKEYPSIHQFRYFFRTHRSLQKEYISRGGIKDYEMNHRPLLGDGTQEFAPSVGVGMVDATICDLYLCNDSGNIVGRPILVTCVDAHSGLCMGYTLLWEGGVYSLQELMLNVISDKVEHCKKHGILINQGDWDCHELPSIIVSDRGSEFCSYQFEQICEVGCALVNLPSYRGELKGQVEKLFDLIQDSYKPYLKGKGVIEEDFQKRGAHDYRKDACLTMDAFEKIVLHCIIYHNTKRVLENFPYDKAMLEAKVPPHASDIWNYGKDKGNLVKVTKEQLIMTLLPRCEARFTRKGLICNKLRYKNDNYVEEYLRGDKVVVAYNPNDVGMIYLVDDDYAPFELIESRFDSKSLGEVLEMKSEQKALAKEFEEENLRGKVELAKHIEAIASQNEYKDDVKLKSISTTRKREKSKRHKDLVKEVSHG